MGYNGRMETTDMSREPETRARRSLTPRLALQLAAPHTWPAAILPCLVAVAAASVRSATARPLLAVALLAICVLMQSAVNAFNDYYDYVKGADTADDNVDPTDATLVYNDVDPRAARTLAVGFLVVAFALGVYPVVVAGWVPLLIALVGAAVTVLYSAGKTPISHLPIGECVSGLVMGGLIPLACFTVLTGSFDLIALLWAVPEIVGVGLIMMTNNTCDIEKDAAASRRTLPVLLGRTRARAAYRALLAVWGAAVVALVAVFFTAGLFVLPFAALAVWPLVKPLAANPLVQETRQGAMGQICSVNVALGAFYAAAILASSGIVVGW